MSAFKECAVRSQRSMYDSREILVSQKENLFGRWVKFKSIIFARRERITQEINQEYQALEYCKAEENSDREEFKIMEYRTLSEPEITRELFGCFIRHQTVTKCLRRENGQWTVREDPFTDNWSENDYETLVQCLKNTAVSGGFVYGAFAGGILKGFVSVESELFGSRKQYLDLSSLHASEEMRRSGIGRTLFEAAKEWAKEKGAEKLYISAHSAIESQAFYEAMGCVDALEYHQKHVEQEPYDRQMECVLA